MKANSENPLALPLMLFLFCLLCTVVFYLSIDQETYEASKIIIFGHPENAT